MSSGRREIKRNTFIRLTNGRAIKRTSRTIGFDEDLVELEEIIEENSVLGCGHQAEPAGWCCRCNRSLCAKCSETTCWVCGRVCCAACQTNITGHKVCRRCKWRGLLMKLWREGF
jgi:hypothetical protein